MHNDLASSAPGVAAAHPAAVSSRPAAEPAAATGNLAAAKTAGARRGRRIGTALLALLAIALLGIYVPRIFPYDFWSDECFSVLLSHMGFKEMLAATAADVHPPFFYAVLMALYRLFGDQAWAYGLASLIPYGASLLLSLTFVHGKFGNGVAACTMLCCAFMHNAITYNTELRMYSWTAFFVFVCFCLLYSCLEKRSWPAHIALGVCAALASYCHYYGFLAAGLILFALMAIAIARRKHVMKMITTCAIAPIAWLMHSVMASRALPKPYLVWGIALLVALVGAPSYARWRACAPPTTRTPKQPCPHTHAGTLLKAVKTTIVGLARYFFAKRYGTDFPC